MARLYERRAVRADGQRDLARFPATRSMPPTPPRPWRLLVLTSGGWSHASSRIRAAQVAPLLDPPFRVTWRPRVADGGSALGRAIAKRWNTLRRAAHIALGRADVVFAQRIALAPWQLRRLRARRIPLVYDVDDALHLDAPEATARMVTAAARVVVSTPALVPFCEAHGKTPAVIPTPVDTDRVTPAAAPPDVFTVGWMGSPWTSPYLDALARPLADLGRQREIRVLLVGAAPDALSGLPNVERVAWSFDAEPDVLRRMSVGVMPLPDDDWTRAKGGYKLLAYMAAGLPCVASPVGVNREIVEPGATGFWATTPAEWTEALLTLCDDADLWAAMGREGRARAERTYSRDVCAAALRDVLVGAVTEGVSS